MIRPVHVVIAACIAAAGCARQEAPEAEAPAPVQVAPARQEAIRRLVDADAVLFPRDQSAIVPKISAPVERFLVKRGDHVKKGQLLAVLENRDLAATAAESKGQVVQAEANFKSTEGAAIPEAVVKARSDVDAGRQQLDAARKLLESRQGLFKQGALARRQVDEAQVAYAQAEAQFASAREHLRALENVSREAQIRTAEAQLQSARAHYQSSTAQLGYSEIRSPIAGIVADRPLYPGEMAGAGAPLLTVIDISRVVARANVPQALAAQVKVGDSATITADAGVELPGKVSVVSPATDPGAATVQVWVEAGNPGERLRPGGSVRVSIVAATIPNAVVIPPAAILPGDDGAPAVAVVGSDAVAHLRKVTLGVREPGKVQVLSGVSAGEQVVISGGVGLEDKGKVRVTDTAASDDEEKK
jgi:multidrug efflux pump subunit AcrA (membrane-fusion protein)